MPASILVGYATGYGSTQEVAEVIASTLREAGHTVEVLPVRQVRSLEGYGAAVLGAPLFMFHWHKDMLQFLTRQREALMKLPLAIFALGPVHDPRDEKEWQDSWSQLDKELEKFPWLHPVSIEMFGGKYDPEKLRFPLKMFAGSVPASDIRDWAAVRVWASSLPAKLDPALAPGLD